ncbi:hypothetical protein [Larsenimonas suaedae]|uniref:Uncharacterized protein n=1 Tax=Larsenimonas suaedae TaxID=1851019 RepID=A0ABU1GZ14_9GAMM|nr:hypothetical protein [Larsenimonas suaedae]MCM2973781.1 hypothetical protein [Larsenimonas suaedae]MDR5897305.1 hypothetical protein [Larsenimonas suaedae]
MKKIYLVIFSLLFCSAILAGSVMYGPRVDVTLDRNSFAKQCPPSFPIATRVRNYSFKTIKSIDFNLELFEGNNTRNLLRVPRAGIMHLIKPFDTKVFCLIDGDIKNKISGKASGGDSLKKAISDVNSLHDFVEKHSIYVSNIRYEYLE